MIDIQSATIGYRDKTKKTVIFPELNCQIERGKLYCILGANGVGKTTLFRSILGFLPVLDGKIFIDEEEVSGMERRKLAEKIAYVPQYHMPPFPYSVLEVILMGRGVHIGTMKGPGKKDIQKVDEILEELGITYLKDCIYTKISGGERQLVLIARALAQEAHYLLMDEPASSLDYGNQIKMLQILQKLSHKGIGICFTSHCPEHALWCAADVIALVDRNTLYVGKADEVINEKLLKEMYGIEVVIKEEKTLGDRRRKVLIPGFTDPEN